MDIYSLDVFEGLESYLSII